MVRYIEYKKEKLPIKLGYYALKMMQQNHGVNVQIQGGDLTMYEPLLFYALQQGHKVEGKEMKFTMEDMVDVLDDCFFEFVEQIAEFFPVDELGKQKGAVGRKRTK